MIGHTSIAASKHFNDAAAARDLVRSAILQSKGWTVLRFLNDDVLSDIDGVCMHIVMAAGLDTPVTATRPEEHHP